MNKRLQIFILAAIFLVALFLRTYKIGSIPPSLNWDEAAWGYNAYSLGHDGRDEFGVFLPYKYIESFGDFKPPVYVYLDVLPIKVLGLNAFATRLPSAIFGALTVLITYFLTRRIFITSKYREWYAFLSSGVLAISPWHINLSRAAFEANVSSFFIVAGVWLFLESVTEKKKAKLLIISAVSFVISLYTFNTARIVSPLLVIVLVVVYLRTLLQNYRMTVVAGIVGLIILLPTVPFLLSKQAALRFQEVNIFSDIKVTQRVNQEVKNDHNAIWSKFIHNRRFVYGAEFMQHYLDNFSPAFLFIIGDGNPKFSTQDNGEMLLWTVPFLIAGILMLFSLREGAWWIIPVWMLLGVIPAATARETPHALRIETIIPTMQIYVAYGMVQLFLVLRRVVRFPIFRSSTVILSLILIFGNFFYYLHGYYTTYPATYSGEWQYGYKDVVSYVSDVQNKYDNIYMTEALGRPYIYFLYYLKYEPKQFRKNADIERDVFGFVHVKSFDKYIFNENVSDKTGNNLYIATPDKIPTTAKIMKTFYLLNGKAELVAYTR